VSGHHCLQAAFPVPCAPRTLKLRSLRIERASYERAPGSLSVSHSQIHLLIQVTHSFVQSLAMYIGAGFSKENM
jgi:hypothetical protein